MADADDTLRATGDVGADGPEQGPVGARIESLLASLPGRTAAAARWLPRTSAGTAATREPAERAIAIRGADELSAASLVKVPIAVELARRVDAGAFTFDERFDLSEFERVGGGGVLYKLDPAWQPTLADLCALMLSVSDNTAANVVLDLVGMGEVNFTMERLKLRHTQVRRRLMDLAARAAGRDNVTSAEDMVALFSLLASNALPHAARLRGMLLTDLTVEAGTFRLPDEATIVHKSGTLPDTAHGAGIMTGPAGTCVYAVLTTAQSDLSLAAHTVAHALRVLWDAWCATPES